MAKRKITMPDIQNRVVETRKMRVGDLLPNPKNFRDHPPEQIRVMRAILKKVGFAGVVLARKTPEGLMLLDGHLRALLVPDLVVDVSITDLNEEEADTFLASHDMISTLAMINQDKYGTLLDNLKIEDRALTDMLEHLRERPPLPDRTGLTDPDDVPPLPEAPWVQPGDLFQLGDHRVLCGDSTKAEDVERLLQAVVPTLLLTDPPYGVNYSPGGSNPRWPQANLSMPNDNLGEEQASFWADAFSIWPLEGDAYVFAAPGPLMFTMAQAVESGGIVQHQWLLWVKDRFAMGRSHYHYRHEHILYGWKGKSSYQGRRDLDSVWECPRPSSSPEHPTMKPVALLGRAIEGSSSQGNVVADPFLGAGSTLMAAERLWRICYGIEIEPRYVQVTIERWQDYTGGKAVLLGHDETLRVKP